MNIPVLLDTDIGSDIDDAVCLAYLLRQPRCQLLGVTTVTGDTQQRAALAAVVCDAAGRSDIPIHAGAPGPLLTGPGQTHVPQFDAIRERPHRSNFPSDAVEFLRRTIRARPGEITLLAIGPLTNIALLFALDPQIPGLLRSLVLMCGVFTPGTAASPGGDSAQGDAAAQAVQALQAFASHGPASREWNAFCDPIATAMVYRARPATFVSVGLEVTMRCQLPAPEVRERFAKAGGPLKPVADMAEVWFRHRPTIVFHDPLAAAVIFEPGICQYLDGQVDVEVASPTLFGLTSFNPHADPKPHRVAFDVNPGKFLNHYFQVVGGV